jgi:TrmH family RNA methyltransferase
MSSLPIRFVLVDTSHPGNIGAVARAMKNMGLSELVLVNPREFPHPDAEAREAALRLVAEARSSASPVAVLFGTERFGLSNEHLLAAHALLRIPANPAYESLNIAMAAQLIAYEIRMAWHTPGAAVPVREAPLASPDDMERFYTHLAQVMQEVEFRDRTQNGTHLMARIRRLFNRAELDSNEVNILRGILTAVQNRRRRAGEGT